MGYGFGKVYSRDWEDVGATACCVNGALYRLCINRSFAGFVFQVQKGNTGGPLIYHRTYSRLDGVPVYALGWTV